MHIAIYLAKDERVEYGHVAQWLEQLSDEEEVGSSNLPLPTKGIIKGGKLFISSFRGIFIPLVDSI